MLPVIAIVGRPNVGKSTLFNRLTGTRAALVADRPGLTRDRQYGLFTLDERRAALVDTAGLAPSEADVVGLLAAQQAWQAVGDSDVLLFVVDAREGLTGADAELGARLRRSGKPLVLAVNKTDGREGEALLADFHDLGLGEPLAISAAHGHGITALRQALVACLPGDALSDAAEEAEDEGGIRVAIVGRPNAGKSTLLNRILGEDRVVVSEVPGTTRDSIHVPFERDGQRFVLIDTAGVRRRARVQDGVERFSVIKTLQSVNAAQVVLLVLDAQEGVTEQDLSLLGFVIDAGRSLLVLVNKWDGLGGYQREQVRSGLDRRLAFARFAPVRFISALHGTGVGELYPLIVQAFASATRELSTPELTRLLEAAVEAHPPPAPAGRRIRLRYAHQGGRSPPVVVIHGNQTDALPGSYRRYLTTYFTERLGLVATPLRIEFRTGSNPYDRSGRSSHESN